MTGANVRLLRATRASQSLGGLNRRSLSRSVGARGGWRVQSVASRSEVHTAKELLLQLVNTTERGTRTTPAARGQIEEAQVCVEAFSGPALNYSRLEGKWKLRYTTAADVLPIIGVEGLFPQPLPPVVQVGDIYQRFSSPAAGVVENIIQFSVPFFLEEGRGVTFTVEASYEVRGPHSITITFDGAKVSDVQITPEFEALLAPAMLPRGQWTMEALRAIKDFQITFPFRSAQQVAAGRQVGAYYQLTYLDHDMLIGRAAQGSFLFTREAPDLGLL